jgi:predicted CXXCH cytochrome family protein
MIGPRLLSILCVLAMLPAAAHAQVAACAPCHADIAAEFLRTGMGRSFYRVRLSALPEEPFYHEASDSYFAMVVRDARVYQRRWQIGFDGNPTNIDEKLVDFVLGSGNHAKTYLHLTARGTLQQLPLGWYAENGGTLAMNPGYDRADYPGSTRAISYECMSCHNAYPAIPAANRERGAEARYLTPMPEGIDCQRCHGPGKEHMVSHGRAAILNPARLTPERELEVCMQCHLETSSRLLPHSIERYGREPFSYVAGQPLSDFVLHFDRASGKNQGVEVAGGAYRFRQSMCFLKSEGKLRCTTCHNPHDIPRGEAAIASYNQVCAGCHNPPHRPGGNCVECHMPKTRTEDAVHVVVTDHRIQRGPAKSVLTAEKTEVLETPAISYRGAVMPYYPSKVDALYDAVAQVRDGSNLQAGLPRLASLIAREHPTQAGFYVDLAEAYRAAGNPRHAVEAFEQALARSPESTGILLKLGNVLIESRLWTRAETVLRRATVRAPSDAAVWGQLGWALWQQDKRIEARAAIEKGVQLDPELPELHNYFASLLLGSGDRPGAEREFREAVRLMPGVAEWRSNLGGLLASLGQIPEARYHFEQSIRFKPNDAAGRFDYARLLSSLGEMAEAEKHASVAVEAGPGMAGAHELLGALRLSRRDLEGAMSELQTAIKLEPNFTKAQYELGVVLYTRGDLPGAVEHLKLASQGGDPDAQQLLSKIVK